MTDTAQPREKPCYDCGKPIYLALMEESGRWWPVKPEPSPDGWVILAVPAGVGLTVSIVRLNIEDSSSATPTCNRRPLARLLVCLIGKSEILEHWEIPRLLQLPLFDHRLENRYDRLSWRFALGYEEPQAFYFPVRRVHLGDLPRREIDIL